MKAPPVNTSFLSCTADFRSRLPSCLQYQPEWCWATAVSELWGFFKPTTVPQSIHGNCHGAECQVAGHILYPNTPSKCCEPGMIDECGKRAGYPTDTIGSIQWTTGKTYAFSDFPLSQMSLDSELSKGYPIPIAVLWTNGGGHMLTLAGCAGNGLYYLHDPAVGDGGQANFYQTLTYNQILEYHPPKVAGATGRWSQTFTYASGSEVVV